jgi:hypothetical protein
MSREGAIIFRDLLGKLDVLNVECAKCGRRGPVSPRLMEGYAIDAKLFDWSDEITADCPRKQARNSAISRSSRPRSFFHMAFSGDVAVRREMIARPWRNASRAGSSAILVHGITLCLPSLGETDHRARYLAPWRPGGPYPRASDDRIG